MSRLSLFIPLGVFLLILLVGYLGFSLDKRNELPSALLGNSFPTFEAADLFAPQSRVTREDIVGRPALVNVWATWCPTCKAEHEELMRIASISEVYLVGLNYKDDRHLALQWLADYGNPYDRVIVDPDGSLGVELGVYGAPETFLLNGAGEVEMCIRDRITLLSPLLCLLLGLPLEVFPVVVLSLLAGTPALSLLGAIGAALTVGFARGGVLLGLLVLPLYLPVLIFGAGVINEHLVGVGGTAQLYWLAFISMVALTVGPFATTAGLKISLQMQ